MKVSVYSTTTCPYCVMVKRWLEDNNIEFNDLYIDKDPKAAKDMIALSGQMSVPFTYVEDTTGAAHGILGYDVATLAHILGRT